MCGRYYLEDEIEDQRLKEQLKQADRISEKLNAGMKLSGEVRPTDVAPVIAPNALNRRMGTFPMQWGFNHPTRGMLVFNTRMETAPERGMFAGSIDDRRCLIPASGYYEWKRIERNKKERYAFITENGDPLFMAGLYIHTSDQHKLPCFSILTQEAEKGIKDIHPRMPVLVPYSRAEEWLSPDTEFHDFIYNLSVPLEVRQST